VAVTVEVGEIEASVVTEEVAMAQGGMEMVAVAVTAVVMVEETAAEACRVAPWVAEAMVGGQPLGRLSAGQVRPPRRHGGRHGSQV